MYVPGIWMPALMDHDEPNPRARRTLGLACDHPLKNVLTCHNAAYGARFSTLFGNASNVS